MGGSVSKERALNSDLDDTRHSSTFTKVKTRMQAFSRAPNEDPEELELEMMGMNEMKGGRKVVTERATPRSKTVMGNY